MDLTGEDDRATQAIKDKEEEEEGDEDGDEDDGEDNGMGLALKAYKAL
jgi:hypothetical protein